MKHLTRKLAGIGLVSMLSTASIIASASPAEQDDRGSSGTIVCGGNHFNRMEGAPNPEGHTASYILRNYNQDQSISVNRFTMYDATGAVLFDFDGTTLPATFNGVLGGANGNVLGPNTTAQYRTEDLIAPLSSSQRPVQVRFEWSAESRALVPEFTLVRNTRRMDRNGPNGSLRYRETVGRHLKECRSVNIEQGRKIGHDKDGD